MVYKLGREAEIGSLPFPMSGKLYDSLLEFLLVLDNEYGADRDVEQDDGGYVLFCTPGTTDSEIQRYFNFAWACAVGNCWACSGVTSTGRITSSRSSAPVHWQAVKSLLRSQRQSLASEPWTCPNH